LNALCKNIVRLCPAHFFYDVTDNIQIGVDSMHPAKVGKLICGKDGR
jgi:hypothetical protein